MSTVPKVPQIAALWLIKDVTMAVGSSWGLFSFKQAVYTTVYFYIL